MATEVVLYDRHGKKLTDVGEIVGPRKAVRPDQRFTKHGWEWADEDEWVEYGWTKAGKCFAYRPTIKGLVAKIDPDAPKVKVVAS